MVVKKTGKMNTTYKTNKELIEEIQAKIIARGNNPYYPTEQHLKDIDLLAELSELKMKYK